MKIRGFLLLASLAALTFAACSNSSGGSTLFACQGGSVNGGASCASCVNTSCNAQQSTTASACGSVVSCYNACQCTDTACISGCLQMASSNGTCQMALNSFTTCEAAQCEAPCGSTTTVVDAGTGG
jgi:hypothetical protein